TREALSREVEDWPDPAIRPEDYLDRLLYRGRQAGHLARADALRRGAPILVRRQLGRAGLSRRRPAARDGRRAAHDVAEHPDDRRGRRLHAAGRFHRRRGARDPDVQHAEGPEPGTGREYELLRLPALRPARRYFRPRWGQGPRRSDDDPL